MGISAFLSECQHDTEPPPGGMFSHLEWHHVAPDEVPDLIRSVVAVDPAVTDTDNSDSMGIQAAGIAEDGQILMLRSWEQRSTPLTAIKKAIIWAGDVGADTVVIETDQGGDTWISVFQQACQELDLPRNQWPRLKHARGGSIGPKQMRAQQMLTDYEKGRVSHVANGHHMVLERALRRFPRTKPFDLTDAAFWAWRNLRPDKSRRLVVR
jgi:phage terminase large subunit-like protein